MENEEDETEIQCDTDTPTTSDACVMDTDGSKRNHNRRKRPLKDKDKKTRSTIDSSSQEIAKKTCSVFEYVGDVVRDLETTRSPNSFGLQVQQQAPFFEGIAVLKKEFVKVSLNDYKGRYLVLFFYPLDFTFVCPTEIIAFSDRIAEFRDINCDIIGCSTDSQYAHLAWTKMDREDGGLGDLNFPLLADKDMSISRSYAVLDERTGIPFRGLFIIDGTQTLRQIIVNDLPIGRSVDEVLRLVQALQFHEQNGEVCPINWKPGDRTIKPDPRGSLEYFQSN